MIDQSIKNFYSVRMPGTYQASHEPRLDFLIEDLGLDKIENSKIGDFGCGEGRLFHKLPKDKNNKFYGFDGADVSSSPYLDEFEFHTVDLNSVFSEKAVACGLLDVAMCFETLEHLENPYRCIFEMKNMLKLGGVLYLSVPAEDSLHNFIYPSLFHPIVGFLQFMAQMAFSWEKIARHDRAFSQNVFTYRNYEWSKARMMYPKDEEKFKGLPPHRYCNL